MASKTGGIGTWRRSEDAPDAGPCKCGSGQKSKRYWLLDRQRWHVACPACISQQHKVDGNTLVKVIDEQDRKRHDARHAVEDRRFEVSMREVWDE